MTKQFISLLSLLLLSLAVYSQEDTSWLTYYEKSNFKETPRYKETIEYCKKLAKNSSWIHYQTFGKSPQNRKLPLILANKDEKFSSDAFKTSEKATLLIEACIHPGEAEGKDAGMMLLRDIAIHKKYANLLDHINLLFIPIFNVDGHERFGPYNRINQNGPKEMGWRTTAQNLNLNRDFLKADAPEMKHWLEMFNKWMPDFFIDIHTTNGADYQYPLTYAMEIHGNMDPEITEWQKKTYIKTIKEKMKKAGYPIFPYISFRQWHNPESGIEAWAAKPRLSQGYTAIQNRPGLLIETHMLKNYKTRVSVTYEMIKLTMKLLNKEYKNLQEIIAKADSNTASEEFRKKPFPVNFAATNDCTIVQYKGIEYKKVHSKLTGANWFKYGDKPVTQKIEYYNDIQPTKKVSLPECYIIPPEWKKVIERIKLHGIKTYELTEKTKIEATSYKFTNVNWRATPYEGRQRISNLDIKKYAKTETFPAGSVIIPMNQQRARIIAHILEPKAPDSFLKWGFFNAIFEQKEYAELYVMEEKARKMLKKNPSLRKEFRKKKRNDKEFANSPWAISNWFYKRTPYWDEAKNNYPVAKIFNKEAFNRLLTKVK
jgi:uncharacterized protein (DUF302 family)